jgi:hypothetical protein
MKTVGNVLYGVKINKKMRSIKKSPSYFIVHRQNTPYFALIISLTQKFSLHMLRPQKRKFLSIRCKEELMKKLHAILAGMLLILSAAPVCAQPAIPKLSVTQLDWQGSCPSQVFSAQGVIEVDRPAVVTYFWQTTIHPSSMTGQVPLTSRPPVTHAFTGLGKITVTSPNLVVPIGFSGGARLISGGYVSNLVSGANQCNLVKSVKLLSDDAKSRCTDGRVILHGMVELTARTGIYYAPVVNNKLGPKKYTTFSTAGFHLFDIVVQTDMKQAQVVGFTLTAPVSMASKTISYKACPAK